ncbi:hypothetical protein [Curtobacterium sp. Leaf261]|uniref:hypothetical protein n=1 Tax=Curtobacterium sp. Leaf261 TaxID=1736311 RepID=UPI0006F31431|nr:hypothetical protein [Curtobacterium sp. Leaf261]KQO65096.1 hypothetical protein ASF23_02945 [Curtobacterium sp. Leaf261]
MVVPARPGPAPTSAGIVERTARITLTRPVHWRSEVPSGTDLRISGDGVVVTVRSRPSDNTIADEARGLLARLPGQVDGVLVVGCDPWSAADAPGRLVEYRKPSTVDMSAAAPDVAAGAGAAGAQAPSPAPVPAPAPAAADTGRRPDDGHQHDDGHRHDGHRHDGHRHDRHQHDDRATSDAAGDRFVAHLLLTTGRHRIDVVAERAQADVRSTDEVVFAVLESVRVTSTVPAAFLDAMSPNAPLEDLVPAAHPAEPAVGPAIDDAALAALQGMAGRRWNPSALRSPAGRTLVERGLVGRFGTIPASTTAILAPWADDAQPLTLEQHHPDATTSRVRAWTGVDTATVLVSTAPDADESAVGTLTLDALVALLAGRIGIAPAWTVPTLTPRLPTGLVERRLGGDADAAALPTAIRDADPVLARLWAAPWTVSYLRRPGRPRPLTIVRADEVGFARVGAVTGDETAFRVEAPANLYRLLVESVLGS